MALSNEDKIRIWRGLNRYLSNNYITIPNTLKTDLQDAINATDTWIEANASSYNAALPNPFRSNASPSDKALLLAVVMLARFSPNSIQNVLGSVD